MTQEEKLLVLRDLCQRLLYGVKAHFEVGPVPFDMTVTGIDIENGKVKLGSITAPIDGTDEDDVVKISPVKPYLRSMRTMTDEENEEYKKTFYTLGNNFGIGLSYPSYESFDWLDKHFFDYRGLIENGLAIEAIEGLYK